MTLAAWITVFITVLVGSSGSGGIVYYLLNRRSQQVQDDRTREEQQKIKADRESTLADAATKWQKIVDESRTEAFEEVERRCRKCETALEQREATVDALIVVGEALIALHPADAPQTAAARDAIAAARRSRQQ